MTRMTGTNGDPTHSGDEKGVTVARHDRGLSFGRIALIAAAVIALIAIGVSVFRGRQNAPPPVPPIADVQGQSDVAAMIRQLEDKMKANPNDAEGWRMLGWSYYRTERFPQAADAYRKAAALEPKNAEGWSALGEAIALSAPPPGAIPAEAEAAFRKAVAIDPANPRARYFLGVKKDLDGDHEGAIADWLALLKETPPGAPWEDSVRQTITQVAAANKIDVTQRLPAKAAPPASAALDAIPGPNREQMAAAASLPPAQQDAMVRGMVDGLAAKLKANPKDADGWVRLMRARMVLGDQSGAGTALKSGLAAFAGDTATQTRISEGARALGVPGA